MAAAARSATRQPDERRLANHEMVTNKMTLDGYLSKMFLSPIREGQRTFDLVVFYDRANGLRFPNEEMKLQFQKDAGLGAIAPPSGVFNTGPAAGLLPRDPASAFELIEKVLKTERKAENGRLMHTVVVIDYAESIFPAGTWGALTSEDRFCLVKLLNWARDPKIMASDNPIILVADSAAQINEAITASASRIELLEMMLPSPTERNRSSTTLTDRRERFSVSTRSRTQACRTLKASTPRNSPISQPA